MCTFKTEITGSRGDYYTPDDETGYKCGITGEWLEEDTCKRSQCPLPKSCEHWKERALLTDELDLCDYHSNDLGLEMTSLCSKEHCPIVDEKYFETI